MEDRVSRKMKKGSPLDVTAKILCTSLSAVFDFIGRPGVNKTNSGLFQ